MAYKLYLYAYKGSGSSQRVFSNKSDALKMAKKLRKKAYRVDVKKV